jgi:SAM-dependent methyltransferase
VIYNDYASKVYDRTYATLRAQRSEAKLIADFAYQQLIDDEAILDLGCGTGLHLNLLREMTDGKFRLIGIDGSPSMVKTARSRLASNASIYEVDLEMPLWPIHDSSIGLAFGTFNIYQSFVDLKARAVFLSELERILQVGGLVIFDSHLEPEFSRKYPHGSITEVVQPPLIVHIASSWESSSESKITSVTFIDQTTKQIIHEGKHNMLRQSWNEIKDEFAAHGLYPIAVFQDWNEQAFDELESATVVAVFKKEDSKQI